MSNTQNFNYENQVIKEHSDSLEHIYSNKKVTNLKLSPTTKVNNKNTIRNKLKAIIILFAFLILCLGILFIIRGVLKLNPSLFNNPNLSKSLSSILNPNTPANLNELNIDNSQNITKMFGDNLKSPYTQDYTDKIWITLKTADVINVGFIDSSNQFNKVYVIPANSEFITLYEDNSISFVQNPLNNFEAKLYVQQLNGNAIAIYTLNLGETFTSTFFETTQKLFYYTYKDTNSIIHLSTVNLLAKSYPLLTSTYINQTTKIIDVDNLSSIIYLENTPLCYMFNIKDKSLSNLECQNILSNKEKKIFWSNASSNNIYSNNIAGEIYLISSINSIRKIIFTGNPGEIYDNITYNNSILCFVTYHLQSTGSSTWSAVPYSVDKLDLSTFLKTTLTNILPTLKLNKVFSLNNNLYALVNISSDRNILLNFNPYVEILSYSTLPLSYSYLGSPSWPLFNNYIDVNQAELLHARYTIHL